MEHQQYLGDGVYAAFDGYQIWLTTQEGMRIAIEPPVLIALNDYYDYLKRLYAPQGEPSEPADA